MWQDKDNEWCSFIIQLRFLKSRLSKRWGMKEPARFLSFFFSLSSFFTSCFPKSWTHYETPTTLTTTIPTPLMGGIAVCQTLRLTEDPLLMTKVITSIPHRQSLIKMNPWLLREAHTAVKGLRQQISKVSLQLVSSRAGRLPQILSTWTDAGAQVYLDTHEMLPTTICKKICYLAHGLSLSISNLQYLYIAPLHIAILDICYHLVFFYLCITNKT